MSKRYNIRSVERLNRLNAQDGRIPKDEVTWNWRWDKGTYDPKKSGLNRYLTEQSRKKNRERGKRGSKAAALNHHTDKVGKDILDDLLPSIKKRAKG